MLGTWDLAENRASSEACSDTVLPFLVSEPENIVSSATQINAQLVQIIPVERVLCADRFVDFRQMHHVVRSTCQDLTDQCRDAQGSMY